MSLSSRIEEELSQFIVFGGLMEEADRRLTAEQVFLYLYDPGHPALNKLAESTLPKTYPNWFNLLQRLMQEEDLQKLTANHEDFAFSVAREALNWCRTTYQKFQAEHDYFQEETELNHLRTHMHASPSSQWISTLDKLSAWYPEYQQSWSFYQVAMKRQQTTTEGASSALPQDAVILRQNILNDWDRFLSGKKHSLEEAFLEQTFSGYYEELKGKVEQLTELGDLLNPFYNFLGEAWNDALGNWNKIDWMQFEEFAQNLQRDHRLRELAEMLGRWQHARKMRQETLMQKPLPKEEWKPNPYGKSEIVGIHHSDHISAMLPSEIALLSYPETELMLSKKYVEKKLLTFQYRSEDLSVSEETKEVPLADTDIDRPGPFIMCIDTSGSMFGTPERIAKALALAILEIALHDKRPVFLISFSIGIQTTEMSGLEKDVSQMIDFLKMSFHGGTDLQPALVESLNLIDQEQYRNADVLIISDFMIPRLERKVFDRIQKMRVERATHFHSLHITRRPDPNATPIAIFDHHWVYDIDNPKVIRQTVAQFETFSQE